MLTCRNISLEDDLDWEGLVVESSTASFFQTEDWLKLCVKHFAGEVKIIGIFDGKNLVGIAPFEIRENEVNFLGVNPVLGNELVSDFGDIIAFAGKEKKVWNTVLSYIKDHKEVILGSGGNSRIDLPAGKTGSGQARMTKGLDLNFIRVDSPSFKILQEIGGKAEIVDVAPYIELPNTWDEYLGGLDRHDRHELRRKMRKIETEDVSLIDYQGDVNDIGEFFRLMTLGNEQKRSFLSHEMKAYFQDIIKTFYPRQLSLSFLKNEKDYLATALTFLFKDEVLLYNSGFDPKYSHFAPGLILKAFLIKQAIEKRKKRFEFLRGGERYKYDLGAVERKLYKFSL